MTENTTPAVVDPIEKKSRLSISPRTRDLLITAAMVGAAVFVANKLSGSVPEVVLNAENVTV